MERVLRGDDYYYFHHNSLFICVDCDFRNTIDDARYEIGNYFRTKEEAEAMAEKIRKVLEGADVIKTPSEKEIEDAMNTSVTESIMSISPYGEFTPKATDLLECAWLKGAEWLKSKIVK